ncbi:MAG: hypothetical protein COB60_12575 [Flavobacteriaceae bacterium]|nr:MAG: hypothetical protein COB60_12575 [Flavobacteriaceae bacterium]
MFNIDPGSKYYLEKYRNSSSKEVTIVMKNSTTSKIIRNFSIGQGKEEEGLYSEGSYFNGGDEPIIEYVSNLSYSNINRIEVYVADVLVKEWVTPSGNFGSEINSPFNYDSWEVETMKQSEKYIEGKVVFTITDEDIE